MNRAVLAMLCATAAVMLAGCGAKKPAETAGQAAGGVQMTPGGVRYEDIVVGTGAVAANGKSVVVAYRGTLDNGEEFDKNDSFDFSIGTGGVIKGWDEGVAGMKVGGKRRLTIPPVLGYGEKGSPPKIPGGATLHFDIELKEVK
jgi:FKBP-type peptidyl-prolyl cis-trans isomerase